jgi:hypothetical protein
MPTRAVACLVVFAGFAALAGLPPARPSPALAAATLLSDAPVLAEPDPGAVAVGWLPAGTAVAVDGPPVAGFYPVRTEAVAGWAPAASLLLDVSDPAANSSAAEGGTVDVAPYPLAATPIADAAAAAGAGDDVAAGSASGTGGAPAPYPDAGPLGPASVAAEAPILAGPGPAFGLIATAPAGSTVEQTGHLIDGFVTVRYAEVTGWVPLDHLAAPPPAAEPVDPTS